MLTHLCIYGVKRVKKSRFFEINDPEMTLKRQKLEEMFLKRQEIERNSPLLYPHLARLK